jgi:hypothetical protein
MADGLQIPARLMDHIAEEFRKLPMLMHGGKIILLLEFNCGTGGVVNDIDVDTRVKRKIKS